MASVPPPKRQGSKGQPPIPSEAGNSLEIPDTGELVPLNFKVDSAFRREFKVYAVRSGISMRELLERSFRAYQERRPLTD
jgi:hypothetical protein